MAWIGRTDLAQIVRSCRGWRGFSPIVALQPAGHGIVMNDECTTPDTGGLRFDQSKHQLNRNGSVDGASTLT
jgi:hypothetical protein